MSGVQEYYEEELEEQEIFDDGTVFRKTPRIMSHLNGLRVTNTKLVSWPIFAFRPLPVEPIDRESEFLTPISDFLLFFL